MNHNDELLSKVANDLKTKNLGAVIRKTRKYIHEHTTGILSERFEEIARNYSLIRDYMLKGYEDAGREEMCDQLLSSLWNLVCDIEKYQRPCDMVLNVVFFVVRIRSLGDKVHQEHIDKQRDVLTQAVPAEDVYIVGGETPYLYHRKGADGICGEHFPADEAARKMMQKQVVPAYDEYEYEVIDKLEIFDLLFGLFRMMHNVTPEVCCVYYTPTLRTCQQMQTARGQKPWAVSASVNLLCIGYKFRLYPAPMPTAADSSIIFIGCTFLKTSTADTANIPRKTQNDA